MTESGDDDAPSADEDYQDDDAPSADEDYEDDDAPERGRWSRLVIGVWILAVVAVAIAITVVATRSSSSTTGNGEPEGVPIQKVPDLASPDSTVGGAPVDGITCRPTMQQNVGYHIHVHLDIFVNGHQERLPAGAGIVPPRTELVENGGVFVNNSFDSCLYWLHVHAGDGIIHVESPNQQTFVLGNFFDVWGQPLGPDKVGPAQGPVVAFVNGQRWTGNPRDIPLTSQAVVQLDVGTPVVAFKPMTFTVSGLCSLVCTAPTAPPTP